MRKVASILLITTAIISSATPQLVGAAPSKDTPPDAAVAASTSGGSLIANGSFEQPGFNWLTPWSLSVAAPAAAIISRDYTAAAGQASARIVVYRAAPSANSNVALAQQNLSLIAGATYTFSFWAKSVSAQSLSAMVQQQASPFAGRTAQTYTLSSGWQQYSQTFTAPVTEAGIKVQFNLAQSIGITWIDAVSLVMISSATATVVPPTITNTATPVLPSATSTSTVMSPSATATATVALPTATGTAVPPTATATNTVAPPTATNTFAPPSATGTIAPPTATPTSGSSPTAVPAGGVQDYPRVASLYSYGSSPQAQAFTRYGLVVSPESAGPNGAVRTLKSQNPATKIVVYFDSSAVYTDGSDGIPIYPGWWLTLAGTTLTAPLTASSTTIHVANAGIISNNLAKGPDLLVDRESMHIISVNTSTNTLTVQRGYYSTATSHSAGVRVAAHASNWSGVWMLNITPYCPVDPSTGLTWGSALAKRAASDVTAGSWDGVFYDNANQDWASFANGQLDANNDNIADGGNGPSGIGWKDGETNLFSLTHQQAPSGLLMGNGGYYPGLSNGQEMEHFPNYAGGWSNGYTSYLQMAGPSVSPASSIVNADTSNTGTQSLQSMRFNLGTALMGNGYYAYDYGAENHGQTWWYDEYDNGAGSSLIGDVSAAQTTLTLAAGTGSKFKAGDVVHVPDGTTIHDDEQMLITAVSGDTLTVQRGYNGTQPTTHTATSQVATQAQLAAGQGWLGQPLAPATSLTQFGSAMVANGSFDQTGSSWLSPWSLGVAAPAAATISQDTSTTVNGQASAKVVVSRAAPGVSWDVALAQQNLSLTAGTSYTLSFWAKSSSGQPLNAVVQQQASPWDGRASQTFTLGSGWQQYSITFTAPATESGIKVQFNLAQAIGTIWIDNVTFAQGDPNLMRRDFTHGTVLLNATNAVQTVTVGPGYRRITGTQDPATNNGAPVSTVTIAPQDAILLVKTG